MQADTNFLVQTSWRKLATIAPQAGELFYKNLFAADPSLRSLFSADMQAQGNKLMQAISFALAKLDDPDSLLPVLRDLGRRHAGYGVRELHYQTVGSALLKTLEQGLGADFIAPVRQAWAAVYNTMAMVMIEASHSTRAAHTH